MALLRGAVLLVAGRRFAVRRPGACDKFPAMTTSSASRPCVPMGFTMVFGGARSGKSRFAQQRAEARWQHPLYLATAEVRDDDEMAERVQRHRAGRGAR